MDKYTGPARRFRYIGDSRVHLPAYLRGEYPDGLVCGDEFMCDRKDWAKSNGFELVVAAVAPLPVVTPEPVVAPEPLALTPDPVRLTVEQFAALSFRAARSYAKSLYGITARSKAELLREYTAARG